MKDTSFSRKLAATADKHIKERDYWLDKMSGEWQKTTFPVDKAMHSGAVSAQMEAVPLPVSDELVQRVMTMSRHTDPMLHVILLSAAVLLLDSYHFSREAYSDIIVGAPVFKQDEDAAYINTVLVLRHRFHREISFKELLILAKDTIAEATGHVNYPLESLLMKLGIATDQAVFPLFDVAVLLENIHDFKDIAHTQPNIVFSFTRTREGMTGQLQYNSLCYRKETAHRIAGHYLHVLRNSLFDVDRSLCRIDMCSPEEKAQILDEFNATAAPYPKDTAIHELFSRTALEYPDKVAVVTEDAALTYAELEQRSSQLAQYLVHGRSVLPEDCIGVMMEKSVHLIVAVLGILKAGAAYVPIDYHFPETVIKNMIDDAAVRVVISGKRHIRMLNRLQWDCPSFDTFLCMDSKAVDLEEETEKSELMGRKLWEYVGEKATDEVTGGGWTSSYTGLPIPRAEMDEYGDNILEKLKPLLHQKMRVLEIGCASGISMYRIAPLVALYYGTDISGVIIEKNRRRIVEEDHQNIRLARLAAHDIDQLDEDRFDLVIINSVIQCFHGHNYLRHVLAKALAKLSDQGYLFLGDLMDQDLKTQLIADMTAFKQKHIDKEYKTKTDWSVELFVPRDFLLDLRVDMPEIAGVSFSGKIYTMENELTRYRYDALLTVNKTANTGTRLDTAAVKHKHQHDRRSLEAHSSGMPVIPYETGRLAYIMYTSGSTGRPKGVMVEHPSVVRLVKNTNYLEFRPEDKILQTGALAFDASTFEIWGALLNGMTLYLMAKEKILSPADLKRGIRQYGITTMWMTAPLFNRMLEEDIDIFAGLRSLLAGGDVLSPLHINRLRSQYPALNIMNGYGPTENTTFSTTYRIERDFEGAIPIGQPIANSFVYIVDGHNRLLPVGVAGELWVAGDGVSRGYLNNPELTGASFERITVEQLLNTGDLSSHPFTHPPSPFTVYKTGDLARWLPEGVIEFLGRIDTQVKIRGFRIEVEEIENRLKEKADISDAVVIARGSGSGSGSGEDKVLCAYFVTEHNNPLDSAGVRDYLSQRVPDFMVPAFLVQIEHIPLTANGKVDRRALPEPVMESGERLARPDTQLQRRLLDLWAAVLDREAYTIGIDDNFFEIGGHSLKATVLVTRIHQALDVKIPLAEIFRLPTVREMAAYIEDSAGHWQDKHFAVQPVELKEYYPLSSAQLRLYILSGWDPAGLNYNVPMAVKISGELDRALLEDVFKKLIRRHESFRTAFIQVDSQPCQRIFAAGELEFEPEYFDISGLTEEEKKSRTQDILEEVFIRPFTLSTAPLLRVGLIKQSAQRHILMVDMHHSIADGTSLTILIKEFAALYSGGVLPELSVQYRDYTLWQMVESRAIKEKQKKYWLDQFSEEIPALDLPYDFPRPAVQAFEGAVFNFTFTGEETRALKQLAVSLDCTLFMTLLALFKILLYKLSGSEDIVVGSPVAGRRHADVQNVVGMFVNTLAFRTQPEVEKSFADYVSEVKQVTLAGFDNQEFQFEELVDLLQVTRDTARNPLFDVVFALHNMETSTRYIPDIKELPGGLTIEPYDITFNVSKFDLTLHATERDGLIQCQLEYATRLFKESTLRRILKYFKRIVHEVVEHPAITIGDIRILDKGELAGMLSLSQGPVADYDCHVSIHQLFSRCAAQYPHRPAVEPGGGGTALTYGQLDEQAGNLAAWLMQQGTLPGDIVAVKMERGLPLIVAILGILKAGGIYLPIDMTYPDQRVQYMLDDSGTRILLTEPLDGHSVKGSVEPVPRPADSGAYVIYTSGSTGRPKGVLVPHRGIINMAAFHWRNFGSGDTRRFSQVSSPGFDAMCLEMWPCLLNGGTLCIVPPDVRVNPALLKDWLIDCRVQVSFQSTAVAQALLDETWPAEGVALQTLLTGGDRLTRFPQTQYPFRFINLFGLTETTVYSTWCDVPITSEGGSPPIGKPISNHSVYILGPGKEMCPSGVPGEICIGGDGLAHGYLNKPELSAEKFISLRLNHSPVTLYTTGDLGKWLASGNIQFLGRIDHQVSVRGYRIELGEIEACLHAHGEIKDAACTVVEHAGSSLLCAYVTPGRSDHPPDSEELSRCLEERLPSYMVPHTIMCIDNIPLTPSGKVDRRALPQPQFQQDAAQAPIDEIETALQGIWADILELEPGQISPVDDFFRIGGHSLRVTLMTARVEKTFEVRIPLVDVFRTPRLRDLAAYIKRAGKTFYQTIRPVEKKEYYPASSAQKRLFFLDNIENIGTSYNIYNVHRLTGSIDAEALNMAFQQLIRRHEALRTSFVIAGEQPVQRVHDDFEFELHMMEHPAGPEEQIVQAFMRPFDLSCAPLLRAALVKLDQDQYLLMMDLHHIISDGTSMGILSRDLTALYSGQALPELSIHYKDFTSWQNRMMLSGALEKQQDYWLDQFKDIESLPILNMPLDYPRPETLSFEGETYRFSLTTGDTAALKHLSLEHGATLYMNLMAVLNVLLYKYSGQQDIIVGSGIMGRPHADLEPIIGMFINSLALRNFPQPQKTYSQFLDEVKECSIKAFENQDMQFEVLVDKLGIDRDPGRNPLFDVLFVVQNFQWTDIDVKGVTFSAVTNEWKTSKFDWTLFAFDTGEQIIFNMEYCTRLFKPATIEKMARHLTEILQQVVSNPAMTLDDITLSHQLSAIRSDRLLEDEDDFGF